MAFRIFVAYFVDPITERNAELCLCADANGTAFESRHVILDGVDDPGRAKFSTVLRRASAESEPSDIVVLANSDIIIPARELIKIDQHLQPNQVYALTRWEVSSKQGVHLWDVEYSQDAWVFRGPPKPDIGGDYWFGVPGCDNRFAHELDAAGYEVLNPSKDIRTYHVHASNERTATNTEAHRVPPPYLYIAPHHLGEAPTINRAATYEQRKQVIARRRARA